MTYGLPIHAGQLEKKIPTKTNEEKIQELTARMKEKYTFQDLLSGKPEPVAIDEQIFALTDDVQTKRRIASILVSVGVRDQVYFDYLAAEAKKSLDSDMPWPTLYDENGRKNDRADNPAFVAWCKKHGLNPQDERYVAYRAANPAFLEWCIKQRLNPQDARITAYYEIPAPWYDLGAARDPRAYGLLVQGLHSHNLMIAAVAAKGLAALQDPKAIDELISTGRRVPGEARGAIAESLLYFPQPKAQAAAEELSDVWADRNVWEVVKQDAKTKGIKGLFGW